jgi:galactose mutarotase-like enzyme
VPLKEIQHGYEVHTIVSSDGGTRASFVPEKGGTGSSLVIGGWELLFQHDFFWERQTEKIPGGWPFLFPICGRLERGGQTGQYLYDGRIHKMPSHGFGPRLPWKVVETDREDTLVLQLTDTEATRQAYPFRFEVRLAYRAEKGALACEQLYVNRGNVPMPYYAGFHPYFQTPAPGAGKEDVVLDYRPVRAFRYNERFTDLAEPVPPPAVPVAVHSAAVLEQRLTMVGADRELRVAMPGGPVIHLAAEGVEDSDLFPYIQLYTMADKPFFCVEPWMGFPNALNTVAGARWLKPGQSERGMLKVWTTQ